MCSTYGEELNAAEQKAKAGSLKMWEGYSAEMEAETQAALSASISAE